MNYWTYPEDPFWVLTGSGSWLSRGVYIVGSAVYLGIILAFALNVFDAILGRWK